MRLGTRVAVVHASLVAVLALAGSWAFLVSAERALDAEMASRSRTVARMSSRRIDPAWRAGLSRGDLPLQGLADAALAEAAASADAERIVVIDGEGRVLATSDARVPHGARYAGLAVDRFEADRARTGERTVSPPYREDGGRWLQSAWEPLGDGAVLGAELAVLWRAPLERLRRAVAFFAMAAAAIAAVAGALIARGITRPLARLAVAMNELGADGLPRPAGVRGVDEVGELGARFDTLVDALRRHDQELRALSATVAHEVRNPLGAMSGFAELIARRVPDPEVRKLTDGIREEVAALERLVSKFLAFAGDVRATRAPTPLDELLDDALRAALPPASSMKVERLYREHPIVDVDSDLLREVFVNLFRNASQATADAGHLVVEIGPGAIVSVRDDGPGIPEAFRAKLFQPFATTKADGTGLGLAICRRIVAAHGGTIEVESGTPGAVFVVRLPAPVKRAEEA